MPDINGSAPAALPQRQRRDSNQPAATPHHRPSGIKPIAGQIKPKAMSKMPIFQVEPTRTERRIIGWQSSRSCLHNRLYPDHIKPQIGEKWPKSN